MTKKQVNNFYEICYSYADAYCSTYNCEPEEIPIEWAVETAQLHADQMLQEISDDPEDWTPEELEEYDACLTFVNRNWRYCK